MWKAEERSLTNQLVMNCQKAGDVHTKKSLIKNIKQKIADAMKQKDELDLFTCDLSEVDTLNGYKKGLEAALKEIETL